MAPPAEAALFRRAGAFVVSAGGGGGPSPLAGLEAAYWDWGVMRYGDDGRLRSHTAGGRHEGRVTLLVDGAEVALRVNQLRLYLAPAYRRESGPGEPAPPAAVAAWLDRFGQVLDEASVIEEYVLERGRRYHARVGHDRYGLPPAGGVPEPRSNPILHLCDRPFDDLAAEPVPIPACRGFSY